MAVEIVVEDERWANLDVVSDRACNAALREVGLDASRYEVVVLGADDARIAVLNGQFRGLARPTNVLSWPSEERGAEAPGGKPRAPVAGELGDIALAWETCNREAEALGWPLDDYVSHLLVHGTLHLLGYDHETEGDAELMEAVEVGVLRELNLPNPYAC